MPEELRQCPFCGSKEIVLQNIVDEDDFYVSCENCGVQQIANHTKPEAVRLWNERIGVDLWGEVPR